MSILSKNLLDEIIAREEVDECDESRYFELKSSKEKRFKKILRDLKNGRKVSVWHITGIMSDLNKIDAILIKGDLYDKYESWKSKDKWLHAA